MKTIIGVSFHQAGKIYYFDPTGYEDIQRGTQVVVETAKGVELGKVVLPPTEMEDDNIVAPLKEIMRIATDEDIKKSESNKAKADEAYKICLEKIAKHELEMKLVMAEYTLDQKKLLFYFTADGRIDFRELVKDLAAVFRVRIELRQIGVRDETKLIGGVGICGRPLCCHSYLTEFIPVSIKMAKEQNLSLNPTKISGVCGRLMCCLKNEEEAYEELNKTLPSVGNTVSTRDGLRGEVQSVSVLRQRVKVIVTLDNDEKEIREYHVSDLKFKRDSGKDVDFGSVEREGFADDDELGSEIEELEQLEQLEQLEKEDGVADKKQSKKNNKGKNNQGAKQRPGNKKNNKTNGNHSKQSGKQNGKQNFGNKGNKGNKGNGDYKSKGGKNGKKNNGKQ